MILIREIWRRLPVVARAVLTGGAAAAVGTVPWALLVSANTRHRSALPWAVPIMGAYLVLYWRYCARGWGWPQSTAGARRASARAKALNGDAWGPALMAGVLGLVSVLLLQGVMSRLVAVPRQTDLDVSRYPVVTVLLWIVMGALVAGVVEETAFRGYMQRPIERRYGPVVAILITGSMFGLAHLTHPQVGVGLLPYYVAVASVYGGLAYLTDSVFPSILLHAGGDMLSAFELVTRGRSEGQLSTASKPLIWTTGLDAAFVANLVVFFVVGTLTVLAYRALGAAARRVRPSGSY